MDPQVLTGDIRKMPREAPQPPGSLVVNTMPCSELMVGMDGRPMVSLGGSVMLLGLPSNFTTPKQSLPARYSSSQDQSIDELLLPGYEKDQVFPTLSRYVRNVEISPLFMLERDVLRRVMAGISPMQAWVGGVEEEYKDDTEEPGGLWGDHWEFLAMAVLKNGDTQPIPAFPSTEVGLQHLSPVSREDSEDGPRMPKLPVAARLAADTEVPPGAIPNLGMFSSAMFSLPDGQSKMPTASSKPKVPATVNSGQIQVQKKLGAGCFGEVYKGFNTSTKEDVAIKFEVTHNASPQLRHEAEMLNLLRGPPDLQGYAKFFHFGQEGNFNCLAMEFLGKSLEDHVQMCGGRFKPKTACLVAQQILMRIEYLHSRGMTPVQFAQDIKPENFMWGVGPKQSLDSTLRCWWFALGNGELLWHHLYIIDFGLSKRYWDKRHVQSSQKLSLTGTARYASLNAHRGFEQSRRDDLEAIGHMLMYFLRSALPWSGLDARTKKEKYQKIKEKKETTKLSDLCEGHPKAFEKYLDYARNLGFKDRPDYMMLRKLFADLREEIQSEEATPVEDWHFEWLEGKDVGTLEPLLPYDDLKQPDDEQDDGFDLRATFAVRVASRPSGTPARSVLLLRRNQPGANIGLRRSLKSPLTAVPGRARNYVVFSRLRRQTFCPGRSSPEDKNSSFCEDSRICGFSWAVWGEEKP
eukprot:s1771_g4.t1